MIAIAGGRHAACGGHVDDGSGAGASQLGAAATATEPCAGLCVPDCRAPDAPPCPPGRTCDAPTGVCVRAR